MFSRATNCFFSIHVLECWIQMWSQMCNPSTLDHMHICDRLCVACAVFHLHEITKIRSAKNKRILFYNRTSGTSTFFLWTLSIGNISKASRASDITQLMFPLHKSFASVINFLTWRLHCYLKINGLLPQKALWWSPSVVHLVRVHPPTYSIDHA